MVHAPDQEDLMAIPADALARFANDVSGPVVTAEMVGYEDVRAIWNGDIDRRPAAIAQCTGPADVLAAIRFARDHDIDVSVRGGGHAVAGHALVDDGLVIDLSKMTGVRVDPDARTARVAGGALWADVDREAQAFGLAVTGGVVSHTGVGGLTLGGGIGHLMRKYGLTIDSLRSCDVVTADGEYLVVDEHQHRELFWGLRGGGGNFGIVTSFEFDLHPAGPIMYSGLIAWPMQDAPSVLAFMRDFIEDAPDEIGLMANLRIAPPAPFIPERLHGTAIIALLVCYAGPVDDGETACAPLRRFGRPVIDALGAQPYVALQRAVDASVPHGNHYYWKAWRLPRLTDDLIATITEHACNLPTPLSAVPIFCQSGAVTRVDENATAYPHRNAPHDINILASWLPGDPESDRHRAWARTFYDALAPHAQGAYVNFLSDERDDILPSVYGDAKLSRLRALKTEFDPTNVFHHNANITPG
jgi:FAD/FMN-containing dehydrogenase